jgi:hypothetical protein
MKNFLAELLHGGRGGKVGGEKKQVISTIVLTLHVKTS